MGSTIYEDMSFFISLTQIFFVISSILFGGLIFFSFAKLLQKKMVLNLDNS